MASSAARAIAAIVTAALASGCLVGCTPDDVIAARLHDGTLEFVACSSLANWTEVEVATSSKNPFGDAGGTAWLASGDAADPLGVIVLYGSPPSGMQSDVEAKEIAAPGNYVKVQYGNRSQGELLDSLFAQFDGDQIREDSWLRSGSHHREPCE